MTDVKRKIGIGSISLLLSILGILFAFSFGDKGCYGDILLKSIGLSPWSEGDTGLHYTIFYSLVFFVPSSILGYKFKNNAGARVGKILSIAVIMLILIAAPFVMV